MAKKTPKTVEVTEEQVLFFRAMRGHLAGPGASNARAAARAILGAQSQQIGPSLLALSLRTKGRPTAKDLTATLLGSPRTLLRTWGQRDTVHLYDPSDWPLVVAAREQWALAGRSGPMPSESTVDEALDLMTASRNPITRTDVLRIVPRPLEKALGPRARKAGMDPKRLAAGRLLWRLNHRGDACIGQKVGNEQSYAPRSVWFPKLDWVKHDPSAACAALTKRYLAVHGPATAGDIAHFFNAKVTVARTWVASIESDLVEVDCGGRKGLLALRRDRGVLTRRPPAAAAAWPLRLLPMWESLLMGHADKTWTVPDDADRKRIWRKAAVVAAVALDRGRAVAIWSHAVKRDRLEIEVEPLSRWRRSRHLAAVKREAEEVARHMGCAAVSLSGG